MRKRQDVFEDISKNEETLKKELEDAIEMSFSSFIGKIMSKVSGGFKQAFSEIAKIEFTELKKIVEEFSKLDGITEKEEIINKIYYEKLLEVMTSHIECVKELTSTTEASSSKANEEIVPNH